MKRIFRYVRQAMRQGIVELQASYDQAFLSEAQGLLEQATLKYWGKARTEDQLLALAGRYGVRGFSGAVARTWYETLLNTAYSRGVLLAFSAAPTRYLYPFLSFWTRADERVRLSHLKLHRFVAPSNWPGWKRFTPPLDWNCRCWIAAVSYQQARQLGWIGKDFPLGSEFLQPALIDGALVFPGLSPKFRGPLQVFDKIVPF